MKERYQLIKHIATDPTDFLFLFDAIARARTSLFIRARISLINPCSFRRYIFRARENLMYRSRSFVREDLFFVAPDKRSAGQRVKILRNFRVYLSAKRIRGCCDSGRGMAGRSSFALFTSRLNVTAETAPISDEKTGSPLDLIGFDISCRWGSSRRRLAINLYPVTRRAVRSQL